MDYESSMKGIMRHEMMTEEFSSFHKTLKREAKTKNLSLQKLVGTYHSLTVSQSLPCLARLECDHVL